MMRQGIIMVVSADGAQGGGEATQTGHVKSVIARSNQDGGGAWREGGREGGRQGGRQEAAEGFEADDALRDAFFSYG